MIARKITEKISVQVAPSLSHYNNIDGYVDANGKIQQKMKNESDGPAAFQGFDFYYQNRPKLLRNGKAVPYKSKTDNLVRSKETDPGGVFISVRLVRIEAHSDRNLEELDLSDWYDALQPGSYQLTNKYRTSFKGPWTKESAEIQFRIEPKN